MRTRLLLLLFLLCATTASAAPISADPDDECSARADAIAAQLVAGAAEPLSERDVALARSAALAGCRDDTRSEPTPATEPETATAAGAEAEEEPSAAQRFLAGLFSFENKGVTKRAGKYRYVEKQD